MLTLTVCRCKGTDEAKAYAREYARFVRKMKSTKSKDKVPPELITAWDANQLNKGDAFKIWQDKGGVWGPSNT